jgi:hypothetical protein
MSANAPPLLADAEVRLTEFQSLRQEIRQRTSVQQALIGLNLTVAASISGLIAAGNGREELFLVLVFTSCTFGLFWLDHHLNIDLIGQYINKELWQWQPSWEGHIRSVAKPLWWQGAYLFAVMFTFLGIAIAGLALSFPNLPGCAPLLWGAGVGVTIFSAGAFLRLFLFGPGQLK